MTLKNLLSAMKTEQIIDLKVENDRYEVKAGDIANELLLESEVKAIRPIDSNVIYVELVF